MLHAGARHVEDLRQDAHGPVASDLDLRGSFKHHRVLAQDVVPNPVLELVVVITRVLGTVRQCDDVSRALFAIKAQSVFRMAPQRLQLVVELLIDLHAPDDVLGNAPPAAPTNNEDVVARPHHAPQIRPTRTHRWP